jgi:integral membrane sensor domain MASE1
VGLTVTVAYVSLALAGSTFAELYAGSAPFWPAAGVASGTLAVPGLRYAPAGALGSLGTCLLQAYPAATIPRFVTVDTAEAVLVAALVRRAQLQKPFKPQEPAEAVAAALPVA